MKAFVFLCAATSVFCFPLEGPFENNMKNQIRQIDNNVNNAMNFGMENNMNNIPKAGASEGAKIFTDNDLLPVPITMPAPPPGTSEHSSEEGQHDSHDASHQDDEIPIATKDSVRSKIGEIKMRFMHEANKEQLKTILRRREVLAFWLAAHNFGKQLDVKKISIEDWERMFELLNNYWTNKLGLDMRVEKATWNAVNKNNNGFVDVEKELVPALFFMKDRFIFDALFSSLFYRVFDFNKNGHIDKDVFKMIKGRRVSEYDFLHQKTRWISDILALPTITAMEIQTDLDEIAKMQGRDMAAELKEDLENVGMATEAGQKLGKKDKSAAI